MSKEKILSTLRKNKPRQVDLPMLPDFPCPEADLLAFFKKSASIAGTLLYEQEPGIDRILKAHFPNCKSIFAPSLPAFSTIKLDTEIKIAELKKIDLAILEAELGVAENGALWLPESKGIPRVLPFITQHLILRLSRKKILANMQEAYQQIPLAEIGFGVFIAGPSKTADIEQSLVIGAQGARSLSVVLC